MPPSTAGWCPMKPTACWNLGIVALATLAATAACRSETPSTGRKIERSTPAYRARENENAPLEHVPVRTTAVITPTYAIPPGSSTEQLPLAAVVPTRTDQLHWPGAARWKTELSEVGARTTTYEFSMRRVGGSPEFRFSVPIDGRHANALNIGRGIFWWLDGATLGLKWRSVSKESAMPPPVFSEGFLESWRGAVLGLETTERQPALHLRGSIGSESWDLWVTPSMDLPPVRMAAGSRSYANRDIEVLPSLEAEEFSPPPDIDFRAAVDEWRGLPGRQADPSDASRPLKVEGNVRAPVLIRRIEAQYPLSARQAHMAGQVLVEAVIDRNGLVRDARVIRSATPLLDDEALKAVRMWRYEPATLDGKPVPVYLTVAVTFRLN